MTPDSMIVFALHGAESGDLEASLPPEVLGEDEVQLAAYHDDVAWAWPPVVRVSAATPLYLGWWGTAGAACGRPSACRHTAPWLLCAWPLPFAPQPTERLVYVGRLAPVPAPVGGVGGDLGAALAELPDRRSRVARAALREALP
jgi:hypothetical protein